MTMTFDRTSRTGSDRGDAPAATRSRPPGWRNPRLLLGLVLVATSVLLGARLLTSADDTVPVWAVSRDLPVGATVTGADLERRQVRFPDESTADAYLSADDTLPGSSTLASPVGAGDLLPRSALATGTPQDVVEVPVAVAGDDLPATVRDGSRVDVWVTPKVSAVQEASGPTATRVLEDVLVIDVPRAAERLAPTSTRQVILGITEDSPASLGSALGRISDGHVVITRHGQQVR